MASNDGGSATPVTPSGGNDTVPEVVTPPPPPAPDPKPVETIKKGPGGIPYGIPVPGKKGYVYSPYAKDQGYVDVRDFSPGTKVTDPYSGKIILVPGS